MSPSPPSRTGSRRREKKSQQHVQKQYLSEALQQFSGYIAVDELYDGPFCLLSIVDNRTFRRLLCQIVDKKVTQPDVMKLLERFGKELSDRQLTLRGITTDGSNLYPQPIEQLFGSVPHQVCRFHVLSAVAKAMRETVVALYKKRMKKLPKLKSGRPSRGRQKRTEQVKAEREHLLALYRKRYQLVARELTAEQLEQLQKLLKSYPELLALRELMQAVYGLYECSSRQQAMQKLEGIRQKALKLKEEHGLGTDLSSLLGPCIEKSLVYLDHPQLPGTSNAVERSNRRYRKMQKSVYRVRKRSQMEGRLALDLLREQRGEQRSRSLRTLHQFRQAA